MNSEDIYSSLRGVTEAIQNFSFRSQEDMSEPVRRDPKKEDGDTVSVHMFLPCVIIMPNVSVCVHVYASC
jgi:hypothetical protein